ncbi:MAG: trehalose-6-phosphate synthase, partial [Pseudomonadota bacterium]
QMTAAVQVNPYDVSEVAEALQTAMTMSRSERVSRQSALYETILQTDVERWRQRFLSDLRGSRA